MGDANQPEISREKIQSLVLSLWYKLLDSKKLLQEMENQIVADVAELEEDVNRICNTPEAGKLNSDVISKDSAMVICYLTQNMLDKQKKLLLLASEELLELKMLLFDDESDQSDESDESDEEEQENELPDLDENNDNI